MNRLAPPGGGSGHLRGMGAQQLETQFCSPKPRRQAAIRRPVVGADEERRL